MCSSTVERVVHLGLPLGRFPSIQAVSAELGAFPSQTTWLMKFSFLSFIISDTSGMFPNFLLTVSFVIFSSCTCFILIFRILRMDRWWKTLNCFIVVPVTAQVSDPHNNMVRTHALYMYCFAHSSIDSLFQ